MVLCSTTHITGKDKDESYVRILGSILKVYISGRLLVTEGLLEPS